MSHTASSDNAGLTPDFEFLFNSMPGCKLVLKPNTPHYTILAVSNDLLQITNLVRESLVGRSLFEVYAESSTEDITTEPTRLESLLNKALVSKQPNQILPFRYDVRNAEGVLEPRHWSAKVDPILGADGSVLYLLITTEEVTELVRGNSYPPQIDLKEGQQDLSKMANAIHQIVWIANVDGEIIYCNDKISEFSGVYKLPSGKWSWKGIVFPEDVQATEDAWNHALAAGSIYEIEHRLQLKDGTVRWFLSRAYPQRSESGEIEKWYGTATDLQVQKESEIALRQSEAWLKAIIEATPECIKIVSPDGTLQFMNGSGLEMIEGPKELLGTACVLDVIAPEFKAEWEKNHKRVCQGESLHWEFDIIGLAGTRRRMETHAVPLVTSDGTMHLAVTRDVTEHNKSDAALKHSEEQFRIFANNIQNLAWMAEPDGWIYWYNQRWYDYTGTNLDEMLGWGWEKVHHPDHVDSVVSFVSDAWPKGETFELTFPLKGADGEYRWFLTRAYAVKDANGQVIRWIGTNTDVDSQKKAEADLEEKNLELMRINNDLDNFIYTASHDLKVPIANIEGLLSLMTEEINDGSKDESLLMHILSLMQGSVNRFKRTIESLTNVVKLQQEFMEEPVPVKLTEVINDVRQDLDSMITTSGVQLEIDIDGCDLIRFSEKNLRSVVYNLLSNAVKYRSPERVPQVLISCRNNDAYHVLTVKDNGLGLRPAQCNQLFGMFKRFHDHVEGSGIGLYMVKKMVENAGGKIEVNSQEGIGTAFHVFFKK